MQQIQRNGSAMYRSGRVHEMHVSIRKYIDGYHVTIPELLEHFMSPKLWDLGYAYISILTSIEYKSGWTMRSVAVMTLEIW